MVFQSYALYPHMTVCEQHRLRPEAAQDAKAEIERRVDEAAEHPRLEPLLDRKPRAAVGRPAPARRARRAIVREPQVFLLDEPLSNLDAKLRVKTRAEIGKLHSALGHDDRLRHPRPDRGDDDGRPHRRDGRRASSSRSARRRSSTTTRATCSSRGFIGTPAMNFFGAERARRGRPRARTRRPDAGYSPAPPRSASVASRTTSGSDVTMGMRPEWLRRRR